MPSDDFVSHEPELDHSRSPLWRRLRQLAIRSSGQLALTKKRVELHGGSIAVKSQLGQGREFTVIFPYIPAVQLVP